RGDAAEHVVAGEQDERAAVGEAGVVLDRLDALFFVRAALGARRVGHAAECYKFGLLAVIERAADLDLVALRKSDSRLEEIEAALFANRQSGTRHDDGRHSVKKLLAHRGA